MAARKSKKDKREPWNKGVEVGPRDPFSPGDVTRIRSSLAKRGEAGLRDLALFSTAIDTMLHASDLLSLTVKDVRQRNGTMRDILSVTTAGRGQVVQCTLSKDTRSLLDDWIAHAGKKPNDHLFTALSRASSTPLTPRQLSRLVKAWAESIGLDALSYGTNLCAARGRCTSSARRAISRPCAFCSGTPTSARRLAISATSSNPTL